MALVGECRKGHKGLAAHSICPSCGGTSRRAEGRPCQGCDGRDFRAFQNPTASRNHFFGMEPTLPLPQCIRGLDGLDLIEYCPRFGMELDPDVLRCRLHVAVRDVHSVTMEFTAPDKAQLAESNVFIKITFRTHCHDGSEWGCLETAEPQPVTIDNLSPNPPVSFQIDTFFLSPSSCLLVVPCFPHGSDLLTPMQVHLCVATARGGVGRPKAS